MCGKTYTVLKEAWRCIILYLFFIFFLSNSLYILYLDLLMLDLLFPFYLLPFHAQLAIKQIFFVWYLGLACDYGWLKHQAKCKIKSHCAFQCVWPLFKTEFVYHCAAQLAWPHFLHFKVFQSYKVLIKMVLDYSCAELKVSSWWCVAGRQ